MLKDVEDRHTELVAVEKSILEVRDLFAAVTVLVMTQASIVLFCSLYTVTYSSKCSENSTPCMTGRVN